MIIVKEIGLSMLIAVGSVAASDVVLLAWKWFSVPFQYPTLPKNRAIAKSPPRLEAPISKRFRSAPRTCGCFQA